MTAPAARVSHPDWCEADYHCTAADGGEHSAAPLMWQVPSGNVVVSRKLRADGQAWAEVLLSLRLPDRDERHIQQLIRVLVAVSAALLRQVVRWKV